MESNLPDTSEPHRGSLTQPSSQETSNDSSTATSRRGSTDITHARPPRERHRVRFNSSVKPEDSPASVPSGDARQENSLSGRLEASKPLPRARTLQRDQSPRARSPSPKNAGSASVSADITEPPAILPIKHRLIGKFSLEDDDIELDDLEEERQTREESAYDLNTQAASRAQSQRTANSRAESLERSLKERDEKRKSSNAASGTSSPSSSSSSSHHSPLSPRALGMPFDPKEIHMKKFQQKPRKYAVNDDTESEDEHDGVTRAHRRKQRFKAMARNLMHSHHHTRDSTSLFRVKASGSGLDSGQMTPVDDRGDPMEYVQKPTEYRRGVLGSLMRLYQEEGLHGIASRSRENLAHFSPHLSPMGSGASTPRGSVSGASTPNLAAKAPKWYKDGPERPHSTSSLSDLVHSSTVLGRPGGLPALKRPHIRRNNSSGTLDRMLGRSKRRRSEEIVHIHDHIVEQLERCNYLVKLCRALMAYGAPTHRLEEYMRMSARVLEINGKFLYIPGCMLVSFEDPSTFTSDVRIVRNDHSVNLGKLQDMHDIYKAVVHDKIGASEGTTLLDELSRRKDRFGPWTLVLFYGLASACVAPFGFQARLIDLPIAFLLGSLLGIMKIILSPRSELYSNVFEVTAALITSFLARAFGSIGSGSIFCFSALAQSSIALILPGYIVLCGALELQSRNLVAGSVRMVYAIIYSLFLGFGITIGTSLYGAIDPKHASNATSCASPLPGYWKFCFVPPFTFCLVVINQGKWKQMPVMLLISFAGYVVNFFSARRFASNVQVSQTLGALVIGLMGNVYSRFWRGLSAAALLPAIFVQVPSGLAASGSLISGLTSANQITNGTGGTTTVSNGTQAGSGGIDVNTTVFNVGYSMVQVAIGITVGLFLSSLIIYPFGKRRSGLFSF
ncbi:hypothetical protein MMC13_001283 [Lambiella insularis]|nr:hypothetical protein [Lambiella insularis]